MSSSRSALRAIRLVAPARTAPLRSFASSSRSLLPETSASASTSAAPLSPKIAPLVDTISTLSLLEVSELVQALKSRLNIADVPLAAAPAAAAPAGGAAPAAAAAEEEKPKEKTIFTVKLEKFDAAAKAKVIREVKAMMPNMNLVEAKKFVESVPQVLKENLPKDEAEKLQKTLTDLGATVSLS